MRVVPAEINVKECLDIQGDAEFEELSKPLFAFVRFSGMVEITSKL